MGCACEAVVGGGFSVELAAVTRIEKIREIHLILNGDTIKEDEAFIVRKKPSLHQIQAIYSLFRYITYSI